jgi:hypothetical protein
MRTVLRVPETDSPAPAGVLEELDEVGQFLAMASRRSSAERTVPMLVSSGPTSPPWYPSR